MNVFLISFILTIFVFTGLNLAYESLQKNIGVKQLNEEKTQEELPNKKEQMEEIKKEDVEIIENTEIGNEIWQVEIPAIDLVAPISEGTTQEVMREYVGHFESTNLWSGNIGLAAHNRRISN